MRSLETIKQQATLLKQILNEMDFEPQRGMTQATALNIASRLNRFNNYQEAKAFYDTQAKTPLSIVQLEPLLENAQQRLFAHGVLYQTEHPQDYALLVTHAQDIASFLAVIGRGIIIQPEKILLSHPILVCEPHYDPYQNLNPNPSELQALLQEHPELLKDQCSIPSSGQ